MLQFTFIISSIFAIVLIFNFTQIIIIKTIETIKNARESF